jgi:hypothetical protein
MIAPKLATIKPAHERPYRHHARSYREGCRGSPQDLRQDRGTAVLFIDPVTWLMGADPALLGMRFSPFALLRDML